MKKYFPIKTDTACKNKWAWSALYLTEGITASCHRASVSDLTTENFFNFHNHQNKLKDRQLMLDGVWPGNGCEYCRDIEQAGGRSDRLIHQSMPGNYPEELDANPTQIEVSPTVLDVFFNNTCNLSCLYCTEKYSSSIQKENKKFGIFDSENSRNSLPANKYKELVPLFWEWLSNNHTSLTRLNILGGEPLIQQEFDLLLDFFESNPNKNLELTVITNLIVKQKTLHTYVNKIESLLGKKKLKRVEFHVSVDCWGETQEYVRTGFKRNVFEENFNYLLSHPFIKLCVLSTVTSLSVFDMPELAKKIVQWNKIRPIGWYIHNVLPHGTSILDLKAFPYQLYEPYLEQTGSYLNESLYDEKIAKDMLDGIVAYLKDCHGSINMQKKLFGYLDEIDRRRNLNWKNTFPWLEKYVVQ